MVHDRRFEAPPAGMLNLCTFVQQTLSMAAEEVDASAIARILLEAGPFEQSAAEVYHALIERLAPEADPDLPGVGPLLRSSWGRSDAPRKGETEPPAPMVARALPIDEGDLIIGARGAATDVCLASPGVWGAFVSLDLYLVRPDVSKVDPSYLVAVLELPATQVLFSGSKQGSGLARLPKDALEKVPIPLPPLPKQRLIAELARSFSDEDRLLKRLADLNSILGREAIARAIRAAEPCPNS